MLTQPCEFQYDMTRLTLPQRNCFLTLKTPHAVMSRSASKQPHPTIH